MKRVIIIGLLLVTVVSAQAQALYTNISTKFFVPANQYAGTTTNTLNVPAGVTAEFVSFSYTGGPTVLGYASVTMILDGSRFALAAVGFPNVNPSFTNLVVGPCTLELVHSPLGTGSNPTTIHSIWTFRLLSYLGGNGFAQGNTGGLPSTAVVIPTDATGPVQIVLESSVDLVNWNAALPGTYGATTTNRFFRVRAVALPP